MKDPGVDDTNVHGLPSSAASRAGDGSGTRMFPGTGGLLGVPTRGFHLGSFCCSSLASVVKVASALGTTVRYDVSGGPIGIGPLWEAQKTSVTNEISGEVVVLTLPLPLPMFGNLAVCGELTVNEYALVYYEGCREQMQTGMQLYSAPMKFMADEEA